VSHGINGSDKFMKAKTLPKVILALAVVSLAIGLLATISHRELAGVWYLAMPLAFVFAGLFVITRALQNEVVKFDEEQRRQKEPEPPQTAAATGTSSAAPGNPPPADTESPPHQMSVEGLWLRGATQMPKH
jgi:hypothetical protein